MQGVSLQTPISQIVLMLVSQLPVLSFINLYSQPVKEVAKLKYQRIRNSLNYKNLIKVLLSFY